MRTVVLGVALALGLTVGLASPAAAQSSEYPPTGDELAVSNGSPEPGEAVTISGGGCAPGAEVTITVDGDSAGSTTADADGNFDASVTIPSDASGTVEIVATCADPDGGTQTLTSSVTVAASGDGSGGSDDTGGLPFTGSSSLPMVLGALALLGVGGVFVVAGRRRSVASQS